MTNHVLGIWTCGQVACRFRVISPRRCICKIPWPNEISELDRQFPSRSLRKGSQQKERAKHSYTERKTEECFQRKTIGSWSRRDACSFLHTHATGDREDNVDEVEIRKKFSPRASILFTTESEETDWRKKLEQSKGQSWKNSLSMMGKMKKIVAWLPTSSRVSWLQVWKQMHSWLLFLYRHAEGEKQPQREVEKRRYLRISGYSEGKKSPRLCISRLRSNEFYSTESWRIGIERFRTHHEILRMHLVQDWIRERKKQSGGIIQKGWTSWAKSLRAQFGGTTTWGNLTTSRLYQQRSVEFGEKICKLKPKTTTFYSPVKAPETQKIVCLLWIRELQCTMLSKENWAQIQWILWEGPKTPYATNRDRVQCK